MSLVKCCKTHETCTSALRMACGFNSVLQRQFRGDLRVSLNQTSYFEMHVVSCHFHKIFGKHDFNIPALDSFLMGISCPLAHNQHLAWLLGQVFATFATFFCSFQQLPKYSKYMQFNVLSCFQGCYIATFCNIFDFCVQLFTAIFFKCCAKCKSVIKKNTKLFQFSSILFDCMKKGYMTD